MSRIFEIVQTLSGQGNAITIPCPYLEFFAGDQQAHLLAAILNQLVFWSGKSNLENGWFYKSHEDLAGEIRGVTKDQVRKAVSKLVEGYLPGVIEVSTRKVAGTPVKHYRIDGDALIARIFPPALETAELPHRNGNTAVSKRQNRHNETAEPPLPGNGNTATSYLYPDLKTDHYVQITTPPETALPEEKLSTEEFLQRHPDAVVYTKSHRQWGTADDVECARWIWSKIVRLYEQAAETDGELCLPKEPNWTAWANEVRLLRTIDGRTHRQICELFGRCQRDPFWCRNILSPAKLREKWGELSLKLTTGRTGGKSDSAFRASYDDVDYSAPPGFRT